MKRKKLKEVDKANNKIEEKKEVFS